VPAPEVSGRYTGMATCVRSTASSAPGGGHADGQVVSEHVLGDGIGHVLATSTGQVAGTSWYQLGIGDIPA
jgi:hypothetical protein